MAGYVVIGNKKYIGTLKSASDSVPNGGFVVPALATANASIATGDAIAEVWFVENEIDTVPEEGINDVDFVVNTGDYLRLNVPIAVKFISLIKLFPPIVALVLAMLPAFMMVNWLLPPIQPQGR
jgi:hypothetical protein